MIRGLPTLGAETTARHVRVTNDSGVAARASPRRRRLAALGVAALLMLPILGAVDARIAGEPQSEPADGPPGSDTAVAKNESARDPADAPAAVPPPGLGELDPWLDAAGDVLGGNLEMDGNALVFAGGALEDGAGGDLTFAGSRVCLEAGPCGGTVKLVGTGSGLTGGPITESGTISIADGGVTTTHLAFDPATQAELDALATEGTINDAGNPVHWTKLLGVPGGLADGDDADTMYAAGSGLSLAGTTFSVDTSTIQSRVTGSCVDMVLVAIGADGGVTCEADDDTTYTATGAVSIAGTVISLSTLGCSPGEMWKWSGSAWSCDADLDTDTTYSAGSGLTLSAGNAFSVDTSAIQSRVTDSCAAGSSISRLFQDGTVACEADDDTTYAAGSGLTLSGTTIAIDPTTVQQRVSGSCAVGAAVRAIAQDGTVTCEPISGANYAGAAPIDVTGDTISLSTTGCGAGEGWEWTGSAWSCDADDDTTYTAGSGLTLAGAAFSVDSSVVQSRVSGSCAVGASIRSIAGDGTVTCEVDDDTDTDTLATLACADGEIAKLASGAWACAADVDTDTDTTYAAGSGLTLAGTTFSADTAVVQSRVTGACAAGSAIASVAQDGTVTCETDDDTDTLAALSCATGEHVGWDGAAWSCAADASGWGLSGNAGTSPATNFIGTTDDVPLEFRVNNLRVLRLERGESPNVIAGDATNGVGADAVGATVGGGRDNFAGGNFSIVSGGQHNNVTGGHATVAGGGSNAANAHASSVGGGRLNVADGYASTVAGGQANRALGPNATVGGGHSNTASNYYSTVSGGLRSAAAGSGSTVGGGFSHLADGTYATIGGGYDHYASTYATVGGGSLNNASGSTSSIGGGSSNHASGQNTVVAGGYFNRATTNYAAVGGGYANTAKGLFAAVAGGRVNDALGESSTVGGGNGNDAFGVSSTIAGGDGNDAVGTYATVGGGLGNNASSYRATVGGGEGNHAAGYSTVAGGYKNVAANTYSSIGGGYSNIVDGSYASLSGGYNNYAGYYAAVGGGTYNNASGTYGAVGGGSNNRAIGYQGSVGGGYGNNASGQRATIPGGFANLASGTYSFAAGASAEALHDGTFVWSDSSGGIASTAANQFLVDAAGGVGINTNAPTEALDVNGDMRLRGGDIHSNSNLLLHLPFAGDLVVGDGVNAEGNDLEIGDGGLCVDDDGSCTPPIDGHIKAYVFDAAGHSDLAEVYPSEDVLVPGDVVVLDPARPGNVKRSTGAYEAGLVSIVSTAPGVLLGAPTDDELALAGILPDNGETLANWNDELVLVPGTYPIALSGRVPTKVSLEGGPIGIGDLLTSSSVPGVAMKARQPGPVIGRALEPLTALDGAVGLIEVFVMPGVVQDGAPAETAALEAQVAEQDAKIADLEARLASLEAAVEKLSAAVTALAAPTTTTADVQAPAARAAPATWSGEARLDDGVAHVAFADWVSEAVEGGETPRVHVTLLEDANGAFVSGVTDVGFSVRETARGTSDAAFAFTVTLAPSGSSSASVGSLIAGVGAP